MSFDILSDLNWLAVIAATVAYFAVGGIWFTPLMFGNAWMRASGIEMPAEGQGPGPAIYLSPLVSNLIATVATAMLAEATASDTFGEGIVLGLTVGFGYAVTLSLLGATFDTLKPSGECGS
jgi:hypothetical protein